MVTLRGVRWERELRHIVLARGGVFHAGGWHLVDVHGLVVSQSVSHYHTPTNGAHGPYTL